MGLTRQTSGYEVGDISCWTPGHAIVIFYARDGEIVSNLQEMGHIDSGVEILDGMESVDVAGPIEAAIELLK